MTRVSDYTHPRSTLACFLLAAPLILASACADDEDGDSDGTMDTGTGTDSSSTSITDGSSGSETTTTTETNTDTDTDPSVARPDGWFPESHEKGMPARLDIVLPDSHVNELVLRITPETWEAIQVDINDVTGGQNDPTIPCIDKEIADICDVNIPGLEGPGVCHFWYGDLVCIPDIVSPCVDKETGDDCESPLMVPSICQESDGSLLCLPDQNPDGEVDACAELTQGDACETELGAGTCNLNGEELSCVLNPDVLAALLNPCASIPDHETCHFGPGEGTCIRPEGADRATCQIDGFGAADLQDVPEDYVAKFFPRDPEYFKCDVEFQGRVWTNVGFRYKGNNSLASSPGIKKPFALQFDEFEDQRPEILDQRFWGFKKLSFHNGITDPTFMRQRSASGVFQQGNVPAPNTAYYAIYLDRGHGKEFLGLHVASEYPEGSFLDRNFENSDGNLYKPDGRGAHFREFIPASLHEKNQENVVDGADMRAFIEALNGPQTDLEQWRAQLASTFDMEGFIRYIAVNFAMDNWDTYGGLPHNYYLYNDAHQSRLRWIAWDFDLSMTYHEGPFVYSLAAFGGEWPLLQAIARDPKYNALYHAELQRALHIAYTTSATTEKWAQWNALLKPYVIQEFGDAEAFDQATADLVEHFATQWDDVDQYLKLIGHADSLSSPPMSKTDGPRSLTQKLRIPAGSQKKVIALRRALNLEL